MREKVVDISVIVALVSLTRESTWSGFLSKALTRLEAQTNRVCAFEHEIEVIGGLLRLYWIVVIDPWSF